MFFNKKSKEEKARLREEKSRFKNSKRRLKQNEKEKKTAEKEDLSGKFISTGQVIAAGGPRGEAIFCDVGYGNNTERIKLEGSHILAAVIKKLSKKKEIIGVDELAGAKITIKIEK